MNTKRVVAVLLVFLLVCSLHVFADDHLPADEQQDLGPAGSAPSNDIPDFQNDPAQFSAWLNDPNNIAQAYEYLNDPNNYRDDFAAEFYAKQPDFATSVEHNSLADKFFSGGNVKSDEQIRINFRTVAGEDGAASKYLSKKYNAPFVITTVGDDFTFKQGTKADQSDPESFDIGPTLTNNGKTVPLDAFDQSRLANANIKRIETTPGGIVIVQKDGKKLAIEGEGQITLQPSNSKDTYFFSSKDEESYYSVTTQGGDATLSVDRSGSITSQGSSLRAIIQGEEIRLAGDFILHKDGTWDAESAIIHTRDVYVKGKSKREKFGDKWDYTIEPRAANLCSESNQLSPVCASVVVDKKTGIAVTAIQKTIVHMDQMPFYSQIAPTNLKTGLARDQQQEQDKKAQEAAQKAVEDAFKGRRTLAREGESHVYINSDGLQTALRVEGPARIDHFITERNIGFEPNARHPHKPVVQCESLGCVYDSLEVGVQTQFQLIGKGKYRDSEHSFATNVDAQNRQVEVQGGHAVVGGPVITKHMASKPTQRVPISISCADCKPGDKVVSFNKIHTAIADTGFDVDPLVGQTSYELAVQDDGSLAMQVDLSSPGAMLAASGSLAGSANLASDAVLDLTPNVDGTDLLVRIEENGKESYLSVGPNGEQRYTVTRDENGETVLVGASGVRVDTDTVFGKEVPYANAAEKKQVTKLLERLAKGDYNALNSVDKFSPEISRYIALETGLDLSNNDPEYRKTMVQKYQQDEQARKIRTRLEKRGYSYFDGSWHQKSGKKLVEIDDQDLLSKGGSTAALYLQLQEAQFASESARLTAQITYGQSLGKDTSKIEETKAKLEQEQKKYHRARAKIYASQKANREYEKALKEREYTQLQARGIALTPAQQLDRGLAVRIGQDYRDTNQRIASMNREVTRLEGLYVKPDAIRSQQRRDEITIAIKNVKAKLTQAKRDREALGQELDAIAFKYSDSDEADPVVLAMVRSEDRRSKKRAEAMAAIAQVATVAPQAADLLEARLHENTGNSVALRQVVARTTNPDYDPQIRNDIYGELQSHNDKEMRRMYIEEYSHYMDIQDKVNEAMRERNPAALQRIRFNNAKYNPLGIVASGASYLSYGFEWVDKTTGFNRFTFSKQDEENEARVMWAAGGRLVALRNIQQQVADGKDITQITTNDIATGVNPSVLDGQAGTVYAQHILCAKKAAVGESCSTEQRFRIAEARLEEKGRLRAEVDTKETQALIDRYKKELKEGEQDFTKGLQQEVKDTKNRALYEKAGRMAGEALTLTAVVEFEGILLRSAGKAAMLGVKTVSKIPPFDGLARNVDSFITTDVTNFVPAGLPGSNYRKVSLAVNGLEREDAIAKQVFVQSELATLARKYADQSGQAGIPDVQTLKQRALDSGNRGDALHIVEIQERYNVLDSHKVVGDSFSRETADVLEQTNNVIGHRFENSDVITQATTKANKDTPLAGSLPKRERDLLDRHIDEYRSALARGDIAGAEKSGREILDLGDELGLSRKRPDEPMVCGAAIYGFVVEEGSDMIRCGGTKTTVPSASEQATLEMFSRTLPDGFSKVDVSLPATQFNNEVGGALVEGARAPHLQLVPEPDLDGLGFSFSPDFNQADAALARPVPADTASAPSSSFDEFGATQPLDVIPARSKDPDSLYQGDIPLDQPFAQTVLEGRPTLPNLEQNTVNLYVDNDGTVKLLGNTPISELEGRTVVQGWVNSDGQILAVAPRKVNEGKLDGSRAVQQEVVESSDWLTLEAQVAAYNEHLVSIRGIEPVPAATIEEVAGKLGSEVGLRPALSSSQVQRLEFGGLNDRSREIAARLHSTTGATSGDDFRNAFNDFERTLKEYDDIIQQAQTQLAQLRLSNVDNYRQFAPDLVADRLARERLLEETIRQAKARKSELTNSLFTSGLQQKYAAGIIPEDLAKRIDTFRVRTSIDTARDIIKRDPIIRADIRASKAFARWRAQSPSRNRLSDKDAVDLFIDEQIKFDRIGTPALSSDADINFIAPDSMQGEVYARVKQRLDDVLETEAQEIELLANSHEGLSGKLASEKLDTKSIRNPEFILATPHTIRQWLRFVGRVPPKEAGPLTVEQLIKLEKYKTKGDARKIAKHGTRIDQARLLANPTYNKRLNDLVEQFASQGRQADLANYQHVRVVMQEAWLAGDVSDDVFVRFVASHDLYRGGILPADLSQSLHTTIDSLSDVSADKLNNLRSIVNDPLTHGLPYRAGGSSNQNDIIRFADARSLDGLALYASDDVQRAMHEFTSLDLGNLQDTIFELERVERRLRAGENEKLVLREFSDRKKEIDTQFFRNEIATVNGIDDALLTRLATEYNHETLLSATPAELVELPGIDHRLAQRLLVKSKEMNEKYISLNHQVALLRYTQTAQRSLDESFTQAGIRVRDAITKFPSPRLADPLTDFDRRRIIGLLKSRTNSLPDETIVARVIDELTMPLRAGQNVDSFSPATRALLESNDIVINGKIANRFEDQLAVDLVYANPRNRNALVLGMDSSNVATIKAHVERSGASAVALHRATDGTIRILPHEQLRKIQAGEFTSVPDGTISIYDVGKNARLVNSLDGEQFSSAVHFTVKEGKKGVASMQDVVDLRAHVVGHNRATQSELIPLYDSRPVANLGSNLLTQSARNGRVLVHMDPVTGDVRIVAPRYANAISDPSKLPDGVYVSMKVDELGRVSGDETRHVILTVQDGSIVGQSNSNRDFLRKQDVSNLNDALDSSVLRCSSGNVKGCLPDGQGLFAHNPSQVGVRHSLGPQRVEPINSDVLNGRVFNKPHAWDPCGTRSLAGRAVGDVPCTFLPEPVRSEVENWVPDIETVGGRVVSNGQGGLRIEYPAGVDEFGNARLAAEPEIRRIVEEAGYGLEVRIVETPPANLRRAAQEQDLQAAAAQARVEGNAELAAQLEETAQQVRAHREYRQLPWIKRFELNPRATRNPGKVEGVDELLVKHERLVRQAGENSVQSKTNPGTPSAKAPDDSSSPDFLTSAKPTPVSTKENPLFDAGPGETVKLDLENRVSYLSEQNQQFLRENGFTGEVRKPDFSNQPSTPKSLTHLLEEYKGQDVLIRELDLAQATIMVRNLEGKSSQWYVKIAKGRITHEDYKDRASLHYSFGDNIRRHASARGIRQDPLFNDFFTLTREEVLVTPGRYRFHLQASERLEDYQYIGKKIDWAKIDTYRAFMTTEEQKILQSSMDRETMIRMWDNTADAETGFSNGKVAPLDLEFNHAGYIDELGDDYELPHQYPNLDGQPKKLGGNDVVFGIVRRSDFTNPDGSFSNELFENAWNERFAPIAQELDDFLTIRESQYRETLLDAGYSADEASAIIAKKKAQRSPAQMKVLLRKMIASDGELIVMPDGSLVTPEQFTRIKQQGPKATQIAPEDLPAGVVDEVTRDLFVDQSTKQTPKKNYPAVGSEKRDAALVSVQERSANYPTIVDFIPSGLVNDPSYRFSPTPFCVSGKSSSCTEISQEQAASLSEELGVSISVSLGSMEVTPSIDLDSFNSINGRLVDSNGEVLSSDAQNVVESLAGSLQQGPSLPTQS